MELELGLSFDDVLLIPAHSEVLPSEVNLQSSLGEALPLNIPLISSAMDTVTEDKLAIALAREGGLGVIHRNMPPQQQAEQVARVKRSENTIINEPHTVRPEQTMAELRELMTELGVSGFPVVDDAGLLVGMVTSRDSWHVANEQTLVSEVMTARENLVTGTRATSMDEALDIIWDNRIEKLPLTNGQGQLVGLITRADIENKRRFQNANKDANGQLRVAAAVGVGQDAMDRASALHAAGVDALFIDAATGHTKRVMELVARLKSEFGLPIVAGNVVTEEGARDLHTAGASAIKVGVGPGSICTTRVIAGVGMPQFSAIERVARYCADAGVALIADGGVRFSGDLVKALAVGANAVMLGSLLAGTQESPGATVMSGGRRYKEYRGMGSLKAMRKGSGDRYGQNSSGKLVAEGVEGRVPYKGKLSDVVYQLMGGVRSGMGYVGAGSLSELRAKAQFVRITPGGLKESHAHDIVITEEPVNYTVG